MNKRLLLSLLLSLGVLACDRDSDQPETDDAPAPTPVLDSAANPDTMPEKVAVPYTIPDDSMNVLIEISDDSVKMTHSRIPAGQITFVLNNTGTQPHALEITASYGGRWRTLPASPGSQSTLTTGIMSGVYRVYCPLKHGSKDHSNIKKQFIVD